MAATGKDYWEQRLQQDFSLGGVGWLGLGPSFNRAAYDVREAVFARAIRDTAGTDLGQKRILDTGSGTGFYIAAWRRLGATDITASDITDVAVRRLRARFPATRTTRFDLAGPPGQLMGEQFDAISCMDVLFHITDDDGYRRAVANLASLLSPGGLLVFTENLLQNRPSGSGHQISRTESEIEAHLKDNDLTTILKRPLFVLMNTPIDSDRKALHLSWRAISGAATRSDRLGGALGRALSPLEKALVRRAARGPSTKLVVAQRRQPAV